MTKEFQAKLNEIQVGLVANKSKRNTFGNYNYRSAEDILEALKPHLKKTGCVLTITDEIVMVGDRIYVKATSTLSYGEESISASAFAREPVAKKGADESQITGMASSYSRKYSLGGLFCIDDGVDADLTNKHGKEEEGGKDAAIKALGKCKTQEALTQAWETYASDYGNDEDFRTAYMKQLSKVQNGAN